MTTIQLILSDGETGELNRRANQTGQSPEALIHEIVRRHLRPWNPVEWRSLVKQTAGTWKDRDDLDGFVEQLRREWDERLQRFES